MNTVTGKEGEDTPDIDTPIRHGPSTQVAEGNKSMCVDGPVCDTRSLWEVRQGRDVPCIL